MNNRILNFNTMIKIAKTKYPVIDVIKNRWSNRAFAQKHITKEQLETLFEAASWAPSCNNEQPWQYYYVQKSNATKFNDLVNCLVTGNSIWAKEADTIVVAVARKTFKENGSSNEYAMYDVGAANYGLLLQAQSMNIYGQIMAGFKADETIKQLKLSDTQQPVAFIALGYLGKPDVLAEPFKTRELTPRERTSLSEFAFEIL